ncbi:uncharacterized protein SPSC_05609 [Sporisorium scitamineum]|uniref:Uncharacterized protein n=1 Tax=Sporisorium scitamineum TaxID=49012 RepID=A0A0F7S7Y8_9BASI|nr:uncharacterized protein SPSC_05609 [Sporisorium scitamineum]CDW99032.1 hypothetical protein [Sporisorium scitamineum]
MSRWRNSLAVLGRIGSIEAHLSSSSPYLLGSAIPDFLAPSLHQVPRHSRRHTASLASTAFEHLAADSSHSSAGTSSMSTKVKHRKNLHDRQVHPARYDARSIDFSSYFDADVPKPSSSASIDSAPNRLRCSGEQGAAYIQMHFNAATDRAHLARLAREFFHCPALLSERKSVKRMQSDIAQESDGKLSALDLNEFFILSLAQACHAVTNSPGNSEPGLMNQLVARYLRRICNDVPHYAFSDGFLSRLAREAGTCSHKSDNTILPLLFDIVRQRLSHSNAGPTFSEEQLDSTTAVSRNGRRARSTSQILLNLMQGFSHIGRSDAVKGCFELLKRNSLPVNVFHYQLQLIALFRERSSDLAGKDQADIEHESHQVQTSILQIKTMMEADSITLDDTALATIVNGLRAPLRNPLASVTSVAQANSALGLVRAIYEQFASQARGDVFDSMPRLVSSLINAEVDAIERDRSLTSKAQTKACKRVQRLIHRLESRAASSKSPVVGLLPGKRLTETHLACIYLKLRLHAVLGDAIGGLEQLRLLLSVKPLAESDSSREQRRELVLKQRSGVINLFSAVMQRRQVIAGRDAAFEVLHCAFSTAWFDRVWTGVTLPSNLGAGVDIKAYDPDASVLRLWTRWIHAWSADYLAEGTRREAVVSEGDSQSKHRTFTGSYPWQTLKLGLRLLNKVIDQYEALESQRLMPKTTRNELDCKPSPRIAAFASAFADPLVLDKIAKLCLRGGRPAPNETMATHVERRLKLLVRTLTRVYAPARTWEHVESFMLRHLALVPREALPTAAVKDTMELIKHRKHLALLRNPDFVRALDQEMTAPETGSIFVLRQMLRQREKQLDTANQPKSAFTQITVSSPTKHSHKPNHFHVEDI